MSPDELEIITSDVDVISRVRFIAPWFIIDKLEAGGPGCNIYVTIDGMRKLIEFGQKTLELLEKEK